jgi:hypothetical protein
MEDENNPKPAKEKQDWVTSFDRDLIRASIAKTKIWFETIEDEREIEAERVLQVDREFIKVRIEDDEVWFNKSHICKLRFART